jgi:hypothetical protein
MTPTKDTIVHNGDPWTTYKIKMALNQGRISLERTWGQIELYDFEADEEEEIPQGAKLFNFWRSCDTLRMRFQQK